MFKWFKKQYKRYKLNNKYVLISQDFCFIGGYKDEEFVYFKYFPGKALLQNAFRDKDPSTSKRHVVINHTTKLVHIQKYTDSAIFKEADEAFTKVILNAYDEYLEELQELELL